jgi:hypothetical protein
VNKQIILKIRHIYKNTSITEKQNQWDLWKCGIRKAKFILLIMAKAWMSLSWSDKRLIDPKRFIESTKRWEYSNRVKSNSCNIGVVYTMTYSGIHSGVHQFGMNSPTHWLGTN